jgi:hypothetical protein
LFYGNVVSPPGKGTSFTANIVEPTYFVNGTIHPSLIVFYPGSTAPELIYIDVTSVSSEFDMFLPLKVAPFQWLEKRSPPKKIAMFEKDT